MKEWFRALKCTCGHPSIISSLLWLSKAMSSCLQQYENARDAMHARIERFSLYRWRSDLGCYWNDFDLFDLEFLLFTKRSPEIAFPWDPFHFFLSIVILRDIETLEAKQQRERHAQVRLCPSYHYQISLSLVIFSPYTVLIAVLSSNSSYLCRQSISPLPHLILVLIKLQIVD